MKFLVLPPVALVPFHVALRLSGLVGVVVCEMMEIVAESSLASVLPSEYDVHQDTGCPQKWLRISTPGSKNG
jgi:hypothetical protein